MFDCQTCGACCAAFRVSFYWAEAAERGIADAIIEQVSPHLACIVGTNVQAPHCGALEGTVGVQVRCAIYAQRPSPCHEVQPGDARCLAARAKHGLK
jgi:uncharacterized protein